MSPSPPAAVAEPRLPAIRGLAELWRRMTDPAVPPGVLTRADRVLLDALGLGLEQTLSLLRIKRPDRAAFEAWILKTAGPPDPVALARYHGWLAGEPPSEAVRVRLAAVEAAAPVLHGDDLARWERDGFVILRAAIDPAEAHAAAAVLWRALNASPDDPESWYGARTNGIMVQLFQHPALDAARRSPRVHKAFAQLWGTADLWSKTDRLSFNPPERPGRPFPGPHLHWDVSLAQPIPFATQGILYLTDTAADQGALQLVPGFHHGLADWLGSLGDRNPRTVDLSAQAITVPAAAGDLVIWRQDLPHGASPNRAALPRLAQYVNMYSADLEEHPVWR